MNINLVKEIKKCAIENLSRVPTSSIYNLELHDPLKTILMNINDLDEKEYDNAIALVVKPINTIFVYNVSPKVTGDVIYFNDTHYAVVYVSKLTGLNDADLFFSLRHTFTKILNVNDIGVDDDTPTAENKAISLLPVYLAITTHFVINKGVGFDLDEIVKDVRVNFLTKPIRKNLREICNKCIELDIEDIFEKYMLNYLL